MITFVKLYLLMAKHKHTHMLDWPCACSITYPDSSSNTAVKQKHYGTQLFYHCLVCPTAISPTGSIIIVIINNTTLPESPI